MFVIEFRIILPMTVDEYNVAQLWSVAEMSKNETGGGEGIEVRVNEPFTVDVHVPNPPLAISGRTFDTGQYTYKLYHLTHKVPTFVRLFAPSGSLVFEEKAWNAYPYCRTLIENPAYMKDNFFIQVDSLYLQDKLFEENVHQLSQEMLEKRQVVYIDIANDPMFNRDDYHAEWDPVLFTSKKTRRGPLVGPKWWERLEPGVPVMCCYKLVHGEFKWWGLQTRVESIIKKQEQRLFFNFNRRLFCWMDNWYGLSMNDIRDLEEQTRSELDKQRAIEGLRGTVENED